MELIQKMPPEFKKYFNKGVKDQEFIVTLNYIEDEPRPQLFWPVQKKIAWTLVYIGWSLSQGNVIS